LPGFSAANRKSTQFKSGAGFRRKTLFRRIPMIFDYSLAALVTAGLMIYLTYALLKPERF
jgi:K+-transporting ATPase KdpF subunit